MKAAFILYLPDILAYIYLGKKFVTYSSTNKRINCINGLF
jgi:hypothetical protein